MGTVQDVRLEIGCGGGEHLIAEAMRLPNSGFIGCEPFLAGRRKMLRSVAREQLRNICTYSGYGEDLLAWLPDASISGIDLLFPDPWPKRKHRKRRFVQSAALAIAARVLRPGSKFRFATDVPDYAEWALFVFSQSSEFERAGAQQDDPALNWQQPWPEFPGTNYESKATASGRSSFYLQFRRL